MDLSFWGGFAEGMREEIIRKRDIEEKERLLLGKKLPEVYKKIKERRMQTAAMTKQMNLALTSLMNRYGLSAEKADELRATGDVKGTFALLNGLDEWSSKNSEAGNPVTQEQIDLVFDTIETTPSETFEFDLGPLANSVSPTDELLMDNQGTVPGGITFRGPEYVAPRDSVPLSREDQIRGHTYFSRAEKDLLQMEGQLSTIRDKILEAESPEERAALEQNFSAIQKQYAELQAIVDKDGDRAKGVLLERYYNDTQEDQPQAQPTQPNQPSTPTTGRNFTFANREEYARAWREGKLNYGDKITITEEQKTFTIVR